MSLKPINPEKTNKKTQDFRTKYKTEVFVPLSRNAGIGSKKAFALTVTAYLLSQSVHLRTFLVRNTFQTPPLHQLQNQALHQLHPQRLLPLRRPLPVPP